jgi:glycosyltransferase involved in cell wall biosynthesis
MAAGLPVVTTRAGAADEVVGDGGLVVPPGDSAALGSALDHILAHPELARRLGRAGQERALALFDKRRFAEDVESVYRLVLNGP